MRKFGRARRLAALGGLLVLCVVGRPAQADPAPDQPAPPALEAPELEAYAASPAVDLMALSPSGKRVARVAVAGEERVIAVTHLDTGQLLFTATLGDSKVRDLAWIGEERVLVVASETRAIPMLGVPKSELYFGVIADLATGKLVRVLDRTEDVLPVLYGPASVRKADAGETVFVRGVTVTSDAIDLYRIDLRNGRGRAVQPMDRETGDYVLDRTGALLARARYVERSRVWTMQLPRDGRFRDAWSVTEPIDTPQFLGMGRSPRTVVVGADRPDLTGSDPEAEGAVLFEVNVDTGEWTRLPFEHDPDQLLHHPETRLLIGAARVEEDGEHYEFIEPTAASRWRSIQRALQGKPARLVSWSDDLRRILIFTDTEDSGLYQLVDFDRGVADVLAEAYPTITPQQVGAVRPIRYAAADGLEISGYLTLPPGVETADNLPLIVLAHGGPASRDVSGFDWQAQALASRGYAVLQANFRGSTGYGRTFLEAGYGEWGRKMQTDLSDGVRWLAGQGMIDPERVCIVGASYGGYAAMAGLTLDRGVYRCAVSYAGVSDLRRMVNWEARQQERRDNQTVRYWNRFMGAARLNDRAVDALSPAFLAETVDKPLLLIHGRDDTVVPIEQSRVMAEAMRRAAKPVELIELTGEDHWMSRAETRLRALRETVRFLEANNPPR
ncbi:S9 family peptidase [Brevundimonas sp. SORGH_AS_0993]|uniref:alpha/beta hydrolase family protein n=1 Tax=Brevundimonas sp. SORGH_AS_0993 TaxID=3041794 RepID=UPI0027D85596|nr:S9 family peptidase [Brevundimonas sp. SORGH_AS_0993]